MLNLFLIRHGETDWNTVARFQGTSDIPLNKTGHQQAAALAKALASETIQTFYASDLRRAWETAQAITAIYGLTAEPEPRLREMSFGDWEGLTYGEIQRLDGVALTAWQSDPNRYPPPQGEPLTQVVNRVQKAYDDMLVKHMGHTVALVSHGGPLQILLCLALGMAPRFHWRFSIALASISELHIYEQGAILIRLNDTHHLYEGTDDG